MTPISPKNQKLKAFLCAAGLAGTAQLLVLPSAGALAAEKGEVFFGFHTTISHDLQGQFRSVFDPILRLIGQKLGTKIQIRSYRDQESYLKGLKTGEFQYGYATDWMAYYRAYKETGAKALLTVKLFGKDRFAECLMVPASSKFKTVADLKGKRVMIRPILEDYAVLRTITGAPPESYYGKFMTAPTPDAILMALKEGIADGGMVPEIVLRFYSFALAQKVTTRSLGCGPSVPPGPLLQGASANPKNSTLIKTLLMNLPRDPSFNSIKPILAKFQGEFELVNQNDYAAAFKLAEKANKEGWIKLVPK